MEEKMLQLKSIKKVYKTNDLDVIALNNVNKAINNISLHYNTDLIFISNYIIDLFV